MPIIIELVKRTALPFRNNGKNFPFDNKNCFKNLFFEMNKKKLIFFWSYDNVFVHLPRF